MNREIKFRAWNGKEILRVDCIDYGDKDIKNTGEIFRVYASGYHYREDEERSGWGRLKDIELMQYTGLKDKNGVEIYEGDIVINEERISYINFNERQACFEQVYEDKKTSFIYRDNIVIGNIYENPELLENK